MNKRGMLIVLSGPSGSGKGTIIKSLLQQREDTVLSISEQCGFDNLSYFNRAFKTRYLMTPREYRRK